MEEKNTRLHLLDGLRGLCVISMVLYHAMYDLYYMVGVNAPWYPALPGYVWQQSICWCFILLSGFCWELSRRPVKHGLVLVGCSALVTAVTWFFMPSELILYGVLCLLGLSGLLLYVLKLPGCRSGKSFPPAAGLILAALLFFLTRDVPRGYLGFEGLRLLELPHSFYQFRPLAVLGFPSPDFVSSDYFPLLPWFFLYLAGHFLGGLLLKRPGVRSFLQKKGCPPLSFIGRHSLLIYLLHQPLLVGVFELAALLKLF